MKQKFTEFARKLDAYMTTCHTGNTQPSDPSCHTGRGTSYDPGCHQSRSRGGHC